MQKKTILIVDDFSPLLEDISEFFEMEGFNVLTAVDGAQGMQVAMDNRPDVIVCDIEMPHINGLKLFETLSRIPDKKNIPFIFLTARARPEDFRAGLKLGADDYITKPFDLEELLESVRLRVEKSEERNQMAEEKFLALFNVPLYGAFLYSKNRFVTLNDSFVSITGYTVNELNKLTISEYLQGNKEEVLKEFKRCKSGFSDKSAVKFSFVNKDKQLIFVKLFLSSVNLSSDVLVIGSMLPYQPDSGSAESEHQTQTKLSELTQYFKDNNQSVAVEIETACKILDFASENEETKLKDKVGLTAREKEVLQLICGGFTNKEISGKLFISPRTVDNHRASILLKADVKNTAALVAFAYTHNLV